MTDPNQPQYGEQPQYGAQPAAAYAIPPYAPPRPLSPQDEKLWAVLLHLSGFVTGWIGVLVGYLVLRDRGPFIRWHSAQALNFQLTALLALIVASLSMFLVIGFVLVPALLVAVYAFMIVAAVKSNAGEFYRMPLTIQFVS